MSVKHSSRMTEYKQSKRVSFRWFSNNKKAIPEEHLEDLEESADERIREMTAEGYTSGQLCASIYNHKTGKETEYSGWWDVTELEED